MSAARHIVPFAALAMSLAQAGETPAISAATSAVEAGMVDVQTLVPDLRVEARYAGSHNFVGAPVRGYEAARCYLLEPVAAALARVERTLRERSMRLSIFDCYRPVRAVAHFVEWANDPDDQRTKSAFYPRLDKRALLGDYIAPTSGHSRGATLDLTLMRCDGEKCAPLDMGTDFDFFDTRANTDSPEVTAAQRAHRELLREAMEKEGFRNYPMEWWHYTLQPEPSKDVAYDFPVK
jgi:D-alanyl-D-alanine dipeptidase